MPSLDTAANGHLELRFDQSEKIIYQDVYAYLKDEMHLAQSGKLIEVFDETICPSFVKNEVKLLAG